VTSTPRDEPDAALSPRVRPYVGGSDSAAGASAEPTAVTPLGLRPFVMTSGRVAGVDPDIGLETQVTARPSAKLWTSVPAAALPPERRAIVEVCAEPVSVAEISARLGLHLGVTRVLVADLRDAGYLDVHMVDHVSSHDPEIILRVMRGLRAIS